MATRRPPARKAEIQKDRTVVVALISSITGILVATIGAYALVLSKGKPDTPASAPLLNQASAAPSATAVPTPTPSAAASPGPAASANPAATRATPATVVNASGSGTSKPSPPLPATGTTEASDWDNESLGGRISEVVDFFNKYNVPNKSWVGGTVLFEHAVDNGETISVRLQLKYTSPDTAVDGQTRKPMWGSPLVALDPNYDPRPPIRKWLCTRDYFPRRLIDEGVPVYLDYSDNWSLDGQGNGTRMIVTC